MDTLWGIFLPKLTHHRVYLPKKRPDLSHCLSTFYEDRSCRSLSQAVARRFRIALAHHAHTSPPPTADDYCAARHSPDSDPATTVRANKI